MIVNAEIKNVAEYAQGKDGFIVVRRDDHDASLWFYGVYESKELARNVAIEIGNGLVLEVGHNAERGC